MDALSELKEQAAAELLNRAKHLPVQLTVVDVAGFLGVSRTSAYKLVHADGFPAMKIPGFKRLVIPKKLFLDWYATNFQNGAFSTGVLLDESNETLLAVEGKNDMIMACKGRTTAPRKKRSDNMSAKKFGSVRQKRENCWEARYSVDGEKHSFTRATEAACRRELDRIRLQIESQTYQTQSSMPLLDYLNDWLLNYGEPTLRHSTYSTYDNYFNKHVAEHKIGGKPIAEITGKMLQRFFTEKGDEGGRLDGEGGLSPKTLRNIRNALNVAFKQAVFDGLIQSNPVQGVKLPKDKKKEMRVLSVSEQQSLESVVNASHDVSTQGIIFALYTGLRIGELLALTWECVDLEAIPSTIRIKGTLARQATPKDNDRDYTVLRHKEGQATAITVGDTKTAQSNRKLYLPQKARIALKKLREWRDAMQDAYGSGWNPGGFVVCTLKGGPMEPRTYSDKLDALVRALGMKHVNFHALRHTYATRSVEKGMDIATLSRNLGHANISTTLNMYVHSLDDQQRSSVKIFDEEGVTEAEEEDMDTLPEQAPETAG